MNIRKHLTLLFIAMGFFVSASAQVNAVEEFLKQHPDLDKYFIYQSSLRMLNTTGDDAFNHLIKDVRKINVYITQDAQEDTNLGYQSMLDCLAREQFETLVSVKSDGMLLNLMSRESGKRSYYVLTAREENRLGVLEMDGSLDLRYLESLENMNFDKLLEIVGEDRGDPAQETQE